MEAYQRAVLEVESNNQEDVHQNSTNTGNSVVVVMDGDKAWTGTLAGIESGHATIEDLNGKQNNSGVISRVSFTA